MDFFEQMEARIPHGEVRTRFAPSPTGYMHVGNLRTALYTYLQARLADVRVADQRDHRHIVLLAGPAGLAAALFQLL